MANQRTARADSFRWSRVVSIAAVLVLHAGFLIVLLAPATRWRWDEEHRSASPADAMQVRLLALPPPPHVVKLPPPRLRAKPVRHLPALSMRRLPPAPTPAISASVASPQSVTTEVTSHVPAYVPGGGRFSAAPEYGRQSVRLPGSAEPVRGAPVFAMADPKYQGIAGAVRIVQSLFGVPDKHCLDVDAWRTLTPEQRIARHIDDARIDAEAAEYGCGPGKQAGQTAAQRIQSMR